MRFLLALTILLFAVPAHAQNPKPLETISRTQYLELSPELQAVYVAGIIDGMSAILFRKRIPGYQNWLDCVRTKTISEASEEVRNLLQRDPGFNQPLTWAVSQVIEDRGCIEEIDPAELMAEDGDAEDDASEDDVSEDEAPKEDPSSGSEAIEGNLND